MSCMYRFYDSFFGEDPDCIDMMFESLPIIGKTSMGVWVDIGNAKKKFINLTRAKKYAYETQQEAFEAFKKQYKRFIFQEFADYYNLMILPLKEPNT